MPPKGAKAKPQTQEKPQKSIASFFGRAPTSKTQQQGAKDTSIASPESDAKPEVSPADAPQAADASKRKRLRQVIEDSPSGKQEELEDLMDEDEGQGPASAAAQPSTAEAPAEASTRAAVGDGQGAKAEEASATGADTAVASATVTAAIIAASPPKKLASIFAKPAPKAKSPEAAKGAKGEAAAGKAGGGATGAGVKATGKGGLAAKAQYAKKAEKEDKAAAERERGDKEQEEDDGEDPIEDSEDEEEEEIEDDSEAEGGEEAGAEAGPSSASAKAKKGKKDGGGNAKPAKKRKVDGGKVDGVGLGAIAAAAKHGQVDVEELIGGRWQAGQPVPFEMLADTFEEIAETSGRLAIIHLLINCFRAILATTPEDLLPTLYLCTNRVAPAHEGIELGIGESTIIKAVARSTAKSEKEIKEALKDEGDLGIIAVKYRSKQKTLSFGVMKRLALRDVLKDFKAIAAASGKSSQATREEKLVGLLARSKGNETGYIVRAAQAKLRIGLAEQSVLVALSHSILLHREGAKDRDGKLADRLEQAAQIVKQAYSECPSYDVLVPAMLAHPLAELPQHCRFMPGVPIKPMLAKATNGVSEVLDKFQDSEFTCEYKYDGERAQLHVMDGGKKVMIFSRNSENNTGKYPDIVKRVYAALKPEVKSIVLDSEAVAWDKEKKKILPFQVLSTRKRKDVDAASIQVQVCVFAFDCLYLNGRSLLKEPLEERRRALYASLNEVEGEMQFATAKTSRDVDELQRFLDEAVEGCTEGLIVKTLGDTYEPAKRSSHWLKLKKDYIEGVGDTIDVVPIGAWHGKGKRTGVYGAYLLSVYDPESETYQTISKLGTGFSEEVLAELAQQVTPHIIPGPKKYYTWGETLEPDVWFDAALVWEVKAADLSISPVHKAGLGLVDKSKGISIRFPRLIRVRDDKSPEDATTAEQIADMYKKQAIHKASHAAKGDKEEEEEE